VVAVIELMEGMDVAGAGGEQPPEVFPTDSASSGASTPTQAESNTDVRPPEPITSPYGV
jgi:hypothetical protein